MISSLKVLLMQDFQTAASVLKHRLPHSAKPHPRILPNAGYKCEWEYLMPITFRLDDITPHMDFAKFERFRGLLQNRGIRPLIGVVPDCRDKTLDIDGDGPSFWDYVKELEQDGFTVAMHGFRHVYTTRDGGVFPLNRDSEFAGVPLEKQRQMIGEGKKILEEHGIKTDLFFAPSHTFDKDTLKVLREYGFTKISDGFGKAPFLYEGMKFYPISYSRKRDEDCDGLTTFVVHTNTLSDEGFSYYEDLMKRRECVSYSAFESMEPERMHGYFFRQYVPAALKHAAVQIKSKF